MAGNITIFKDTWAAEGQDVDIFDVLEAIRSERWKARILALEGLDKDEYTRQKKYLPCVTFSGTFAQRKASGLKDYSNIAVIDIDNLEEEDLESLRTMLSHDRYVLSYFVSPSRKGLKILVQVSNPPDHHNDAALQLEKYFQDKYTVKVDASGKDICRLCYVSYDAELHLKQAEVFPVTIPQDPKNIVLSDRDPSKGPVTKDIFYIYDVCKKWVEEKLQFVAGSRNTYRHAIACALNRCGVDRGDAQMLIEVNLPPSDDSSWHQSVRSAYSNKGEFGMVTIYEYEKAESDRLNKVYVEEAESEENLDLINKALVLMRKDVPYRLIRQLLWSHYDLSRGEIEQVLNKTKDIYEEERTESMAAQAGSLESFESEIFKAFIGGKNVLSYNSAVDECLGGFVNGNLYGLCGREKAGKSLLVIEMAIRMAMAGMESNYFNFEMSLPQFWARAALMITGVDIEEEVKHGTITPAMIQDVMDKVKSVLKGKLIVLGKAGMSAQDITSLINKRKSMGFDPKIIFIDGISHLSQHRDEINSAIENSKLMKQMAIDTDLPVILLMHTTGAAERHTRDAVAFVRGNMKVRANLDAFISISVCIDEARSTLQSDPPDIQYIRRKAWLRIHNARGNGKMIDKIFNLNDSLNFIPEDCDPAIYEVNMKPSRR